MLLGILNGYNAATKEYTDGQGNIVPLPKPAYIVSGALSSEYTNISNSAANWYNIGKHLIGGVAGFRDYLSWRSEIRLLIEAIAGTDYSAWNSLSNSEKTIALILLPTKIIDAKGYAFFASEVYSLIGNSDSNMNIINAYLNDSENARSLRYDVMIKYAYQYLGKNQGLKAEYYARQTFTNAVYVSRGVLYKSEDDIDGFGDWILSKAGTSFETTGLKARIDAGEFTLSGGISSVDFCSNLIGIVENGLY